MNQRMPEQVSAWLHIAEDGSVTVYTGKVEVGQNARTSLTQAAAEELHAPIASIQLVMGDTALTPFDMGTSGSGTTPNMWPQIRKAPTFPQCGGAIRLRREGSRPPDAL